MGSCYCVESSVVGCLLCHAGCSTDKLASSLAFHPPSPPSYALTTAPDGRRHAVFDPANDEYVRLARDWGAALGQCEVDEVQTRRGNTVCVLRLRRGVADDAYVGRATLIVSHGNALDAALFVPFASHLAHQLDANVSVYDYSGYGRSSGAPRVEDCKADIEAVVRHHVERLGCDEGRVRRKIGYVNEPGFVCPRGDLLDRFVGDERGPRVLGGELGRCECPAPGGCSRDVITADEDGLTRQVVST